MSIVDAECNQGKLGHGVGQWDARFQTAHSPKFVIVQHLHLRWSVLVDAGVHNCTVL